MKALDPGHLRLLTHIHDGRARKRLAPVLKAMAAMVGIYLGMVLLALPLAATTGP